MAADSRDGGFYKCEECSKAFNRMASYEAHIRMHAEAELDILDVVFNYTGKMHESVAAPPSRRVVRSSCKNTATSHRTTLSPFKAAQRTAATSLSAGDGVSAENTTAALKIVNLLLGRDNNTNTKGPTSEATVTSASDAGYCPAPVWFGLSRGLSQASVTLHDASSTAKELRGGYAPYHQGVVMPASTESERESLVIRVPLKFCSAGLLGKPVINLTKQTNLMEPHLLSVCSPSSSAIPDTSTHLTLTTAPAQDQISSDKNQEESPTDQGPVTTSLPPAKKVSKIIRLDSLGLAETSDASDPSYSPEKVPMSCIKRHKTTTSTRFQCPICHRLLATSTSLKRHNLLHTGEKPYRCSICDKAFTQPHHRQNHELSHYVVMRGGDRMTALMEEKVVSSSSAVKQDSTGGSVSSSVSSSVSPPEREGRLYQCNVCQSTFVSIRRLKEHLTTHDANRLFQCEICKMKFLKKAHLAYHSKTMHMDERYSCLHCDKKFSRSDYLKRHMLQHTQTDTCTNSTTAGASEMKFMCSFCSKVCCSLSGLTRHQAIHFPPREKEKKKKKKVRGSDEVFTRDLCGKGEVLNVKEEFPAKVAEKGKTLPINEEGTVFSTSDLELELDSDCESELSVDLTDDAGTESVLADMSSDRVGGGETDESADNITAGDCMLDGMCNGDEMEPEGEMGPLRLDTSEDSSEEEESGDDNDDRHLGQFVQCNGRGGQNTRSPYRNPHNHLKGKGGVPQYKCEWCGRLFLKRDYLRQHYSIHQQVPHQCHVCGKVFMSRRYLRRHISSKHIE